MTDELNFTTPEELEKWLQDKPIEWAQVIAARTALRVLPVIKFAYRNKKIKIGDRNRLTLLVLRACFVSLSASRYPAEGTSSRIASTAFAASKFADPAYAAVTAAYENATAASTAFASASSAYDTISATDVTVSATSTAFSATYSAYAVVDSKVIWSAISWDAGWLVAQEVNTEEWARILANQRFWFDGAPERMRKLHSEFTYAMGIQSPHHLVWAVWYNNVFDGEPFFDLSPVREKALTLKIAQQENNFWEQDFAKVSKIISGWLDEARKEDAAEAAQRQLDEEVEPDKLSVPVLMPATLEPEWQNGRLTIPTSPLDDES